MRPGWDPYFLGIAAAVAARADCTRRQVGAVLVRPDHTIASTGYNGAPPGAPGCASDGACPRGRRTLEEVPPASSYDSGAGACIALHAEQNCLAFAREDTAGMTLYVTCEPCPGCRRTVGAYRLARVVWPGGEAVMSRAVHSVGRVGPPVSNDAALTVDRVEDPS